jgi:hypothetical protein
MDNHEKQFPHLPLDVTGRAILRTGQTQWNELAAEFGEDQLVDRVLEYVNEVFASSVAGQGPVGEVESTSVV